MTPMLKQYFDIKDKYKDSILFFRLGDFYEMFSDDAIIASQILDIVLTKRNKGTDNEVPMCGVPHHSANSYIDKLTNAGKKVAICEQITDPSGEGIVERDVVQVITPGTRISDSALNSNENNFVCAISQRDKVFSLGFIDLSTGDFFITSTKNYLLIVDEISRLNPTEIITRKIDKELIYKMNICNFKHFEFDIIFDVKKVLSDQYNISSLESLGLEKNINQSKIAGFLLSYLLENQRKNLPHIKKPKILNLDEYMHIDNSTLKNLQILNSDNNDYSLLSTMDQTITSMGGRLIKDIITKPLLDRYVIEKRYNLVSYFCNNKIELRNLRDLLKKVKDIERIVGKIGCNTCKPHDLLSLKSSCLAIKNIQSLFKKENKSVVYSYTKNLLSQDIIIDLINYSILDDPAIDPSKGRVIKKNYNQKLSALFDLVDNGTDLLLKYQQEQRKVSGISNLKIKYNRVFGYFIEVSNGKKSIIPDNYKRRQTLANAERYTTEQLKEIEIKLLSAKDDSLKLEKKIFSDILYTIQTHIQTLQVNASKIAFLDVMQSFSFLAIERNYCCPTIKNKNSLLIEEGRHPVVETTIQTGTFIPNNTTLTTEGNIKLLTGPNMAGKSTYLRQVALIALMAQVGSFVSAKKMEYSLIDGIFTRVGANDNLAQGQSTFMVEMQESAYILNNSTENSLVILDEIGRGTSTYDGLSIAWSILEYIHNSIKSKTLFATHYHELIEVAESLENASNLSVDAIEENGEIFFLYNIVDGGVDRSYGVEVANLAGLPNKVINRSKEILHNLEITHSTKTAPKEKDINQSSLFENIDKKDYYDKVDKNFLNSIKKIDINNITPIEALSKLQQIQIDINYGKNKKK